MPPSAVAVGIKFTAPRYKRVFEQAGHFQIPEQSGDGFIDTRTAELADEG